jgi:hypothetical protein
VWGELWANRSEKKQETNQKKYRTAKKKNQNQKTAKNAEKSPKKSRNLPKKAPKTDLFSRVQRRLFQRHIRRYCKFGPAGSQDTAAAEYENPSFLYVKFHPKGGFWAQIEKKVDRKIVQFDDKNTEFSNPPFVAAFFFWSFLSGSIFPQKKKKKKKKKKGKKTKKKKKKEKKKAKPPRKNKNSKKKERRIRPFPVFYFSVFSVLTSLFFK